MKRFFYALLLFPLLGHGQIFRSYIDTQDPVVTSAVDFYVSYFEAFQRDEPVDYRHYWPEELCAKYKTPDFAVYAISSDYPTYTFGAQNTLFYARRMSDHVHIKSLLSYRSDETTNTVYAILNHYVRIPAESGKHTFISPLELHKSLYENVRFGHFDYYFPKTVRFDPEKAKRLDKRLSVLLKAWGFEPVDITYFYTRTPEEMSAMRGFDYRYGDEMATASGMSSPEERLVFSVMSGEDHLHEVLHIYFNPRYGNSPVCHALIYYLAGGLGHDFQWFVERFHHYMQQHPDTDLSAFDTVVSKDMMLHIDHTVLGMICRKVDRKEGVAGLKRLLGYPDVDRLFEKEFGLQRKDWPAFIRKLLKEQRI